MKLDKAIELNIEAERSLREHKFPDHSDAIQLGIEALKRTKARREQSSWKLELLLPGEDPPDPTELSDQEKKRLRESPLGGK